MERVETMLTKNPCYTAGKKIKVSGLMLHSVGCPQPKAEVFIKQMNRTEAKVCVHAFIDGNTGIVYQTLPWDCRAWHCGGGGNNTHIGVEMCEPSCIKYTGGATIACSDEAAAKEVVKRTCAVAVELFAELCKKFGLDPLKEGVIVSHKEGHDKGMASGHADPDHLFRQLHMNYSMDDFRKEVSEAMKKGAEPLPIPGEKPKLNENAPIVQNQDISKTTGGITVGSLVSLLPDAVYYGGKSIPDWVKSDRWFVKSITNDRVVIDKNESGTKSICSPIDRKYLKQNVCVQKIVSPAETLTESTAHEQKIAAPQGAMTSSDRGVELVAKYEGCRLEAYKCPAGVWTIGYGHTAGVKQGDTLPSKEKAKELLKEDLKKYGGYVNNCVKKGIIKFALNQNQFDALTSFCYNCGNGNLQKLVADRDAATVADKMLQYNKGGGKVLAGLTRRREEERALFLSK